MNIAFHEKLFADFKAAALEKGVYPKTLTGADNKYLRRFEEWLRVISNHRTEIDDPDYDIAWVFPRLTHPTSKRYNLQRQATTMIVAVNTKNGCLEVCEVNGSISPLQDRKFFTAEGIKSALRQHPSHPTTAKLPSFNHINSFLRSMNLKLTLKAASYFQAEHTDAGTPKKYRPSLNVLAQDLAQEAMEQEQKDAVAEIELLVKRPLLDFTEKLFPSTNQRLREHYKQLQLYNFLAKAPDQTACSYRMGALTVLAPMGDLILDNKQFWIEIDQGIPLFAALGHSWECKPSTIKHILKKAPLYSQFGKFQKWAENLDVVDFALWPKDHEDARFFYSLIEVADIASSAFKRDKADVFRRWAQDRKTREIQSWRDVFGFELRHQITDELTKRRDETKRNTVQDWISGKGNYPKSKNSDTYFHEFIKKCIESYRASCRSIKDMHEDVTKRLIRPALLLAMRENGVDAVDKITQEVLEGRIEREVWGNAAPSDQAAASSYWHSPRVNFSQRFRSIASTPGNDFAWAGLFAGPINVGSCVLHPLQSRAELQAEADVMQHCVWSYAHQCLAEDYHIFSVRSQEGKPLSTLAVRDFVDDQSRKRKIRPNQNQAFKNQRDLSKLSMLRKNL